MSFYRIRGLVNYMNIANVVAVSLLKVKKDPGASCPKFHRASFQLQILRIFR